MTKFLMGWGSLIIATIALMQPWIISIWKKFFRGGEIDIHETGGIELGFSNWGATVGLYGTLRAVNRDLFVRSISLTVTKLKDSSQHNYEWGLFRSAKLTASGSPEMSFELPSGFMLTTAQPYRYNIHFFDTQLNAEIRQHWDGLREVINRRLVEEGQGLIDIDTDLNEPSQALRDTFNDVIHEVRRSGFATDNYTFIDRLCYWEPGKYSLKMCVNTARPDKTFIRKWDFVLSSQDSQNLHFNSIKIVNEACFITPGQYTFAYAQYQARE